MTPFTRLRKSAGPNAALPRCMGSSSQALPTPLAPERPTVRGNRDVRRCGRYVSGMRLVTLGVRGYKRFAESCEMNVDGRVVAIVGPNEAGKTSWLRALAHLNEPGELQEAEWTRGQSRGTGRVVWGRFALDDSDYAELSDVPNARNIRWYELWKDADGKLVHRLLPGRAVHRDERPRQRVASALLQAADHRSVAAVVESSSEAPSLADSLRAAHTALASGPEDLTGDVLEQIAALEARLAPVEWPPRTPKYIRDLAMGLDKLSEHERAARPEDVALSYLAGRRPRFLLFGESHRDLRSDYELLEHADDPPTALDNLSQLAGLDLEKLRDKTVAGDFGEAERLLEDANRCLQVRFAESWRQSAVFVRLRTDGTLLRILISATVGGYTSIAERSDGLRAFIALLTFSALHASDQRPILLLDEAENHLHYDAQADLVRVFSRQQTAAKIVYTTHSAGCLPQDLAGVRLIVPGEHGRSEVRNWFWADGAGFTPLLIGMGASVMAFTPTRYAVFAEGGSEVVLLPTLLRDALGLDAELGYQVVPSLSEITAAQVAGLDLEAARVACVVDGDTEGGRIRRKLIRGGMPEDRIVSVGGLGSGLVLEDLVDLQPYVDAVNAELGRSHGPDVRVPTTALQGTNRARRLKEWCERMGVGEPNKRAVGYQLLRIHSENGVRLVSGRRRQHLRAINRACRAALKMEG